ncbi:MAG: polyketide synthase, partial [Ilumatobacteraceae bacterium]|nr:polyketide synthase [Ilumatobacteraceae bacterium]
MGVSATAGNVGATEGAPIDREPIAIVGIGCRLPGGADDPASLWRLLCAGFDAIGQVPPDRFDVEALYDERPATPGRIMSRWGGFLTDVDRFDAEFFETAPREAERLDPQQRLLLETSWEALEDAGLPLQRLQGSSTGVFVGMWLNDFESRLFADPEVDLYMTTGTGRYSASGRISFFLDLLGPSVSVDTACSSSLVAVHLACQSLRSGECDVALAGGANVILEPQITIAYSQARMMAPDGRCKFGDAAADGYVRSDGAAMVVLKRLSSALADGDRIHAVVRGSAVTNDGRSSGFLATPGQRGQEEVLRRAYADAGVDPSSVQYVEAHGTGTAAGDPVELRAVGAVIGAGRAEGAPCLIGSLKTNVGHTEGAAGVAGLIKAALALEHREVPASLHVTIPNPDVDWTELGLEVCTTHRPWPVAGAVARAGVSSYGIAGTNAHVVLEAAPAVPEPLPIDVRPPLLLPISARAPGALRQLAAAYHALLADGADVAWTDVCAHAALHRTHHDVRAAVVADDVAEMATELAALASAEVSSDAMSANGTPPRIAFVFPGQGSQWAGMARELLADEPVFRAAMERCDAAIRDEAGWSIVAELAADAAASRLGEIDVVQPLLFAIQVALAAQWRAWGIEPAVVVGHSMGEVAAAHVAGALGLGDAVAVICRRSGLLRRVAGHGAMAVVDLTFDDAAVAIAGEGTRLAIAVSNSPRSTVISGDPAAIDRVLAVLEARDVFCRRVKVDVASHSPQVDGLLGELRTALAAIAPSVGEIPFCSTVDVGVVEGSSLDADYWARNLRQPVLFGAAIAKLAADGITAFIELSPHPVLRPGIEEVLEDGGRQGLVVGSLRRAEPERRALLTALGALYAGGAAVDWRAVFPGSLRPVQLPTYPWQRERFWYEPAGRASYGGHPLLGHAVRPASAPGTTWWETTLDGPGTTFLRDHLVRSTAIMPATGFVGLALAAVEAEPGEQRRRTITDLAFVEALPLDPGTSLQIVVEPHPTGGQRFQVHSATDDGAWRQHAHGVLQPAGTGSVEPVSRAAIKARCPEHRDATGHDETMRARGLDYGSAFRTVAESWTGSGEAIGRLERPVAAAGSAAARISLLDGGLQLALAALPSDTAGLLYLPVGIELLDVDALDDGSEVWAHAVVRADADGSFRGEVHLFDAGGRLLADIRGLVLRRAGNEPEATVESLLYELRWDEQERVPGNAAEEAPGTWIVLGGGDVGPDLATRLRAGGDRCVLVAPGQAYARVGPDEITVDPAAA